MRILVNDHEGPIVLSLCRRIAAHLHVGLTFVGVAFRGVLADGDAVVDDVQGVGTRGAVNRAAVVLVDVDVLGEYLLREQNVFTGDDARAADRHVGGG